MLPITTATFFTTVPPCLMLNVPCKKAVMFIFLMLSTPMLQQSRVKVKKYANYFLLICFIVRVFKKEPCGLRRGPRAAAAAADRLMIAKMRSCIIEENIKMRYNQYAP